MKMRMRTVQKIGEKKTEKFGTFEFFLTEEDQVKLICTHGDKTAEATYVGKIQGHNAMKIESLDVKQNGKTMMFIGIPDSVYNAFQSAKSIFALKNICLQYAGRSAETGIKWYSLSAEVPRDTWKKIAKHFSKFDRDEEDALDGELRGWLTAQPDAVEKILNVKEELTLSYRREQAKKRKEEEEKKAQELQAKLNDIEKAFAGAEYPDPKMEASEEAAKFMKGFMKGFMNGYEKMRVEGEKIQHPKMEASEEAAKFMKGFMKGYEKMRVEGEKIQHPIHRENIYGGGQWWVIQEKYIWKIENNGSDGDNWSMNNIDAGGAGAIGIRVPYTEELANKIRDIGGL